MTLEKEAEMLSTSIKADDGITIEIGQAYYEGDRVFLSYRLTGNLFSTELHEGAPEESYQWSTEIENFIAAESFFNEVPELQRLNAWLDGKGQRWGISFEAMLHDGLMLEDGTYLDIYAGNNVVQEDGSVIGWKECKIPEEKLADTLTFKAVLYRGKSVEFQDGSTFRMYYDRGESTDIFFMLRRNDRFVYLKGAAETAVYQVQAEFIAGKVDLRPAELQTAIIIPNKAYEGYHGNYIKYAMREAMDIANLGCSVNVSLSEDKKTIRDVRIAYGVAGPIPTRAPSAEAAAKGRETTRETVDAFAQAVLEDIHPRDSWRAAKAFREHIAVEMAKRALTKSIELGGGAVRE